MSHDHSHGGVPLSAGGRHRRRLAVSLLLIGGFFLVEATAAVLTGSLALLSDAGHMLTDVVALGMAFAAITLAARHERARVGGARSHHTFGLYRLEILAALANAVLLVGVAGYVLVEAAQRLRSDTDVETMPMLVVGSLGLAVNLVAFSLLRQGAKESLNLEGAYLEVLADTLSSAAVILASIMISVTGLAWIDTVAGAAIGVWILPRAWRLGRRALRILLQSAPATVDVAALEADLAAVPDVIDVHDVHVWTLTSGMDAMSAHLRTSSNADSHSVLDRARSLVAHHYGIDHATLQVEPADHRGCDAVAW